MSVAASAVFLFLQAPSALAASEWQVDQRTPICSVRQRNASTGETIELSRTPGNDETELTVSVPAGSKLRKGRLGQGIVGLVPGGASAADLLIGVDEDRRLVVYAVIQAPTFIQTFAGASTLEVSHPKVAPIRTAVRAAAAAAKAFQNCEERKMREWGIDPLAWRGLKSRPVPLKPVREQFRELHYPRAALARRIEADAVTRLDVDANGQVEQCRAVNQPLRREFEEAACRVLRRAQFRPALDSTGKAVAAPYTFNVRFRVSS
jgi:TonB family protein